mmetsp:Transcript_77621/g.154181  ORF Transcript_77621/g.154181 Transcript_77621/m.154181 type:complete len:202 (-) Transcript_77621:427-1032(-)
MMDATAQGGGAHAFFTGVEMPCRQYTVSPGTWIGYRIARTRSACCLAGRCEALGLAWRLLDLAEVILDLLWCEDLKRLVCPDDPNLNVGVVHCSLETLLEGEQRGVHSILEFQVVIVALLEESLRIDHVLPDGTGLPREVRPRRIDLVQLRTIMVKPGEQHRHAEWPHTATLCKLLHHSGDLTHEHGDWYHLAVDAVVSLR